MRSEQIVIVGGGLAGLTAARHLVAGVDPHPPVEPGRITVVEAAPAVGGRLATTAVGDAVFDHGAQFFTVRSDPFRTEVDRWLADGAVEVWCYGFQPEDGYPRYRAAGGMQRLAHYLAERLTDAGVTVTPDHPVTSLAADDEAWTLSGPAGQHRAGAVVVTPPVPEALELVRPALAGRGDDRLDVLDGFACHRVLALLAVLDRPATLEAPGALQQPADPTFSFVSDNQSKGISDRPAVTFHTAHALSAELWSSTDDEATAALLPAAREVVAPAAIVDTTIVRWPCSGPVQPHPDPCLIAADKPGPLVLAGDGFGGSKVEGAFLSGRAAAEAVALGPTQG